MSYQSFSYDKRIFANNLNHFMRKHHDTQVDISRLLGVSKSTVSSYCAGTQMPRMDKIEALSKHFGIRMSELLEDSSNSLTTSPDPQIKETSLPEGLSDVKQLLIEEILAADDADIADLISYLKVKKGITLSDP